MKILLLSIDGYSMVDEQTGEVRTGTSCWYLNDYREDLPNSLGNKPTKISGSEDLLNSVRSSGIQLPAYAELSFVTRPGAGGKAALTLSGVEVLETLGLF